MTTIAILSHFFFHDDKTTIVVQISISSVFIHERFELSYPFAHDVALVHLSRPARILPGVCPVCLPTRSVLESPEMAREAEEEMLTDPGAPGGGARVPSDRGDPENVARGMLMGWGRIRYNDQGEVEVIILVIAIGDMYHYTSPTNNVHRPRPPDVRRPLPDPEEGFRALRLPLPMRARLPRGRSGGPAVRRAARPRRLQGGLRGATALHHLIRKSDRRPDGKFKLLQA